MSFILLNRLQGCCFVPLHWSQVNVREDQVLWHALGAIVLRSIETIHVSIKTRYCKLNNQSVFMFCVRCCSSDPCRAQCSVTHCCCNQLLHEVWNDTDPGTVHTVLWLVMTWNVYVNKKEKKIELSVYLNDVPKLHSWGWHTYSYTFASNHRETI